ncbi:hypothetical protein ACJRO7_020652 [Eucalyptus globulus]|uniref:Uncharacterized protein n=1 Tax=Eucalyptus globulus TaxID=34317 RepID=A0ABD3KH67_EUCGL
MLMSLKTLALQRARGIGREHLAEKFDLKMLRSMGMILMEHLKGKVKDLEGIPGFAGSASHLDASNLLKSSLENFMTLEDIKACLNTHLKRGPLKRHWYILNIHNKSANLSCHLLSTFLKLYGKESSAGDSL